MLTLLAAAADPAALDKNKKPPLFTAAEAGNAEAVQVLLGALSPAAAVKAAAATSKFLKDLKEGAGNKIASCKQPVINSSDRQAWVKALLDPVGATKADAMAKEAWQVSVDVVLEAEPVDYSAADDLACEEAAALAAEVASALEEANQAVLLHQGRH